MLCSRLLLFQTGATSMPSCLAFTNAASCALPWWAKRSPMPMLYLGKFISSPVSLREPVRLDGGRAEDPILLGRRQRRRALAHAPEPSAVIAREETHRPIRPKHQPLR